MQNVTDRVCVFRDVFEIEVQCNVRRQRHTADTIIFLRERRRQSTILQRDRCQIGKHLGNSIVKLIERVAIEVHIDWFCSRIWKRLLAKAVDDTTTGDVELREINGFNPR